MNLQTYLVKREALKKRTHDLQRSRGFCTSCRQAPAVCDCKDLRPFDPQIQFVILIHPEEVRRRIATGRLTHSLLKKSLLLEGERFCDDMTVNSLIASSDHSCFVLYPGSDSLNLTTLTESEKSTRFVPPRHLVVFVIDGTWRTAKKMLRLSPNLSNLPKISFNTPRMSGFRIRKQPAPEYFSTIEAVHHVIELIAEQRGFSVCGRKHDHLLDMFDKMVRRQIEYQRHFTANRVLAKNIR